MKTREEATKYGLSFPDTYLETPFHDPNWELVRVHGSKKAFLWVYERNGYINLNVKVRPEWRDFWRDAYASVLPGYHQNKEHWNTIILDGTIPDKDVKQMIAESYDIITDSPTKRIYEAVKTIPKGKVATYGRVAELAGNPRMSRAVGNALHHNPDPEHIPCYRVVNSKGELAGAFAFGGEHVQEELLNEVSRELKSAKLALEALKIDEEKAGKITDAREQAFFYKDVVKEDMDALRAPIDHLEMLVEKDMWPMPTYADLMFEV